MITRDPEWARNTDLQSVCGSSSVPRAYSEPASLPGRKAQELNWVPAVKLWGWKISLLLGTRGNKQVTPSEASEQGLGGQDHLGIEPTLSLPGPHPWNHQLAHTHARFPACTEQTLTGLDISLLVSESQPTFPPSALGQGKVSCPKQFPGLPKLCPFPVFAKAAVYLTMHLIPLIDVSTCKYIYF